jgi:hypothetical protein
MSDITATPLGHTDFTLSTVTPAPQQRRQLQQQQHRVQQLYDSTPGHHDGSGDSSSGITTERRQQQQHEFDSVLQVSAVLSQATSIRGVRIR